jgi:hypothetical protein
VSKSHATLRYTSMRVSIFAVCFLACLLLAHFGVIPVAGQTGVVFLVLLAAFLSAPISYALLGRQRDEMSEQLVKSVSGLRTRTAGRIAAQNDAEDALDDAARARRAASDAGAGDTPASA